MESVPDENKQHTKVYNSLNFSIVQKKKNLVYMIVNGKVLSN